MSEQTNNKTIAKNTIMLYTRMLLTMSIGLFTSRAILQILGVTDYGIYQAVGGVVGFMSFINGALATGTSRFLTFELGKGNNTRLKNTFSTTLTIHIALAVLIVIVAETVGLWFVNNKLVIPEDRFDAAVICFHLSILSSVMYVTQAPYSAAIMAHEKMGLYAYVSIADVVLRLAIVYMLCIGNFDKLVLYAVLSLAVSIGMQLFYRIYCVKYFPETKYNFVYDKTILKEIGKFSGWSLLGNLSIALSNQGILLLLNMFFAPTVVAARAISLQVNGYINTFVNNFRTAVNPQIVKRYAAGDFIGHKSLLIQSTKYSFFLLYMISLPVLFTTESLLHLWLGVVPNYTVVFTQLIIVQSLFSVIDSSLYMALNAKGNLKLNALISPAIGFIAFPVIYVLFKCGDSPVALSWAYLIVYVLLGCIIKPILLIKVVGYKLTDFIPMFTSCLKVTIMSLPIPLLYSFSDFRITNIELVNSFVMATLSAFSAIASIWYFGLDKNIRFKLISFIVSKIKR